MSRRLIIRTEPETDIFEAAIWYEGRERCLGLEVTSSFASKVESHQRQLVDGSSPAYRYVNDKWLNPTNGSWWIVQVQPNSGV